MAGRCRLYRDVILRKRVFQPEELETTDLKRCLRWWDCVGLGAGSSLVVGLVVVLGPVTGSIAGPSIVLSFLISGVAALLAGVCYAEWTARVPRAGAAYSYASVALGELAAFLVGWNLILEALFGTASLASGLTKFLDALVDSALSSWFEETMPISYINSHFDLFAFLLVIVIGILVTVGVRETTSVNAALLAVTTATVAFLVVAGAFKATLSNWSVEPADVPMDKGEGGFFPYGVAGTLRGVAVCLYAYTGFDAVCYAAEEVRDPRSVLPRSVLSVIGATMLVYLAVSLVTTMMVPYFLQGPTMTLPLLFQAVGLTWAKWILAAGCISVILNGVVCGLYPAPRLIRAMAADGLLPRTLSAVPTRPRTPVFATLLTTAIIAVLAGVVPLSQLVLMTSLGTSLSSTAVAASLLLVRYRSENPVDASPGWSRQVFGCGVKSPSRTSTKVAQVALALFVCACVGCASVLTLAPSPLVPALVLHALAILPLLVLALQPQATEELSIKAPLVPLVPCLSIYINVNVMVLIAAQTWMRIAVWILIGIPVYVICTTCYKRKENRYLSSNISTFLKADSSGKPPVQIIIESPTPPDTMKQISNNGGDFNIEEDRIEDSDIDKNQEFIPMKVLDNKQEITVQHVVIENTEEKEAKIIDLLDQVLQAEEDTYGEIISIKDQKEDDVIVSASPDVMPHRKSLSELSDAGSDASLGSQVLSKYDVIAQVHREDLPKVDEDEEKNEREPLEEILENEQYEQVTAFNDSETNSRTDESGYSDTIDNNTPSNDFTDDSKEDLPYIPEPPPLDENYFAKKSYVISIPRANETQSGEQEETTPNQSAKSNIFYDDGHIICDSDEQINSQEEISHIPEPPPLDENYFTNSNFKKSYTISLPRANKTQTMDHEESAPRQSVQSNSSYDDGHMVFGSDKQMNFISKLNNIFQNKITSTNEDPPSSGEKMKRSHSAGNVVENTEFDLYRERPPAFLDLQKELLSKSASQNLRPVNADESSTPDEDEDTSMSRDDLKTKLESIFASGGPTLLKPRLMKSNPPTPEDYPTDSSSIDSIPKLPNMDKNDTLKRQKDKFGAVLNSFRLNLGKDEVV